MSANMGGGPIPPASEQQEVRLYVFCVDVSGSMRWSKAPWRIPIFSDSRAKTSRDMILRQARATNEKVYTCLVTFNEWPTVAVDVSEHNAAQQKKMEDTLMAIEPNGDTNIFKAYEFCVRFANEWLRRFEKPNVVAHIAVDIFTDGYDNQSTDAERARNAVLRTDLQQQTSEISGDVNVVSYELDLPPQINFETYVMDVGNEPASVQEFCSKIGANYIPVNNPSQATSEKTRIERAKNDTFQNRLKQSDVANGDLTRLVIKWKVDRVEEEEEQQKVHDLLEKKRDEERLKEEEEERRKEEKRKNDPFAEPETPEEEEEEESTKKGQPQEREVAAKKAAGGEGLTGEEYIDFGDLRKTIQRQGRGNSTGTRP
eukprot:Colp12_sorted_trinity150504_noHs@10552